MMNGGARITPVGYSAARAPFVRALPAFAAPHPVDAASLNGPQRIGFLLLLAYLLMLGSRLQDFVRVLHLPALVISLALLASFASGVPPRILTSRIAMLLMAMTVLMGLSIPFSVWKGGAMHVFLNKWLQTALIFIITASLLSTVRHVYYAVGMFAFAILIGALITYMMGGYVDGRLVMDNGSRFADPNDLAQFLLLGLCFGMAYFKKDSPLHLKIGLPVGLGLILIAFLRTGSRGGFVGLMAVTVVLFLSSSGGRRLRAILAGLFIAALIFTVVPQSIRARYAYVFGVQDQNEDQGDASADARQELFWRSVRITAQHPLLGVGPGMFAVAENDLAKDLGARRGMWHETHNMYTQVSSEVGIPAFLIFAALLYTIMKMLTRIYRLRGDPNPVVAEAARLAYWIRLAMIAFLVTGIFLSCAYTDLLFVLCGLTVALERAIHAPQIEIAAAPPAPPARRAFAPAPYANRRAPLSR
jgi:O-antigen ligase